MLRVHANCESPAIDRFSTCAQSDELLCHMEHIQLVNNYSTSPPVRAEVANSVFWPVDLVLIARYPDFYLHGTTGDSTVCVYPLVAPYLARLTIFLLGSYTQQPLP